MEVLCKRVKNSAERTMLMELLYRFYRITQSEVGSLVGGIDYSAVSQARSRLQRKLEKNQKLKERFERISNDIIDLSRSKV